MQVIFNNNLKHIFINNVDLLCIRCNLNSIKQQQGFIMALKQVQIEERAEKHLAKLVKKRKDAKVPYGRKTIVAEAILNLKG